MGIGSFFGKQFEVYFYITGSTDIAFAFEFTYLMTNEKKF